MLMPRSVIPMFVRRSAAGKVYLLLNDILSAPNRGIEKITAWLFDEARKIGDWGRVDVGGATYILIYTDNGMSYGEVQARSALFDLAFAAWHNGWVESLVFGYNYDCLDSYDFD